jgi:mRNA-degrading endonuclease HigB of HigAB toxin-antitoxin module
VLSINSKSISNSLKISQIDEIDSMSIHNQNPHYASNNTAIPSRLSSSSRRQVIGILATTVASMTIIPTSANAGKAIIDSTSGQLYSPKADMLRGGGSDLARGIKMESRDRGIQTKNKNDALQSIYETRFITYLSRFLLNFDPAAKSWWEEQDFTSNTKVPIPVQQKQRFSEFSESVEIGLADYFVGPYGSYGTVEAAKAGLRAVASATSSSSEYSSKTGFFDSVKRRFIGSRKPVITDKKVLTLAKQGVLNLFSLLVARYTSIEEKKQLAILFSLISDPNLQPTSEIKGLIGEVDNGTIVDVELVGKLQKGDDYRLSSHRGGGYSVHETPKVRVEPPPGLGSNFLPAKIEARMKCTTRILKINVVDGGQGYTSIPTVQVYQDGIKIACEAAAILDRDGTVESVVVLNPGLGYGRTKKGKLMPPEVVIAPPRKRSKDNDKTGGSVSRQATATAELEFAIEALEIVEGGNGYIFTQPPLISIDPPSEDPDWYLSPIDPVHWTMNDTELIGAEVKTMICNNTNEKIDVFSYSMRQTDPIFENPEILESLSYDPLVLLPSSLRPNFIAPSTFIPGSTVKSGRNGYYTLLSIPDTSSNIILPSPRYRAYDPIFGPIAAKPVTKSAQALTGSEYTRLALSGGICTVIVRTALNPLELVKTKIQLKTDKELLDTAMASKKDKTSQTAKTNTIENDEEKDEAIGTLDALRTMIDVRGIKSLFQSADATFLASIVFGSVGFGATELFRRSFTMIVFETTGPSVPIETFTILYAAALACILTSFLASPFEILRVRSMGYVAPQKVGYVLSDFLEEKREQRGQTMPKDQMRSFKPTDISKDDIEPLFSGFLPILSRELPFAVVKFFVFDLLSSSMCTFINAQPQVIDPVEVGVGSVGLIVSAFSGAIAGLAGAIVSHPADLILTLTSSQKKAEDTNNRSSNDLPDWKPIVKELVNKDGGILNLFTGLGARSTFFFLVIGLQFFLYDYAKTIFQVGSDDLALVLDVFYAIRQGLM